MRRTHGDQHSEEHGGTAQAAAEVGGEMTMGPEDIEHREFAVTIRGYEQDEVRTFLRQLAQRWRDPTDRAGIDRSALTAQEFVVGLRGYDREEVRSFLRDVAAEAGNDEGEKDTSDEDVAVQLTIEPAAAPPEAGDSFAHLGDEVASVLRSAQDAARGATEAAEQQAARRRTEAEDDAARILEEARSTAAREADEIRERARADAERVVADARTATEREADEIRSTAAREADEIRSAAEREADEIRERARADAERVVAEAEERATAVEQRASDRVEQLRRAEAEVLDRFAQIADLIELAQGELAAGTPPANGAPEHAPSSLG